MERITVVVPAYNVAPWLPRCLDSLLNQTYEELEILAVDDGSADGTGAVLEDYAAKCSRVRVIHQENSGVTAARLRGAAAATGDWIGFMDGDDEVEPEMYARLLENAKGRDADIAHCGHRVCFPDGRVEYLHNSGQLRLQDHYAGLADLLDGGQVESSLCTKLFRRTLFRGLEDWMDPTIRNNEDLLMNYYLFAQARQAVYEDICPYHYLLRSGSASYRQLHRHSIFDPIRVRQIILERCEPALRDDARRALLRNSLFAYPQQTLQPDRAYEPWREEVRRGLSERRAWFPLLSRRNRLLAHMICAAPWSFRLAYGAYVKLFQRQEQH